MSAIENPYNSSRTTIGLTDRQWAFRQLLPPAILLLAGAVLTPIAIILCAFTIQDMYRNGEITQDDIQRALQMEPWILIYPIGVNAVSNAVVIYASIQMLYMRKHKHCVFGAIVATIPILSPGYILGIPVAIWALVILLRKETRNAFAEASHPP